jgi:glutathione synthase/RimK-type ligase-like ATP-grasp enzyme
MKTAVIVAAKESYRTGDFLAAASLLRINAIVATDAPPPVTGRLQVQIDPADPEGAGRDIAAMEPRPDAVIAIDDQGVVIAAEAAALLGLKHNAPNAVRATRDKLVMRDLLDAAEISQSRYREARLNEVPGAAADIGYPVVVKPRKLSASRGVIRADGPKEAARAEERTRAILADAGGHPRARLLVEEYIPGAEVAVEGLMVDGDLEVLAVIDKPDPLVGPYFEETLYVTPSRHSEATQDAVTDLAESAARALGLHAGPIHAEVRLPPGRDPVLVEIAARSIGGLCGRAFTFGLPKESLEVMILRSALGLPTIDTTPAKPATGVLMLPIPATGTLTAVEGVDDVLSMDGIDDVEITIPTGRRVVALPEGDRYLGFVFASGADPAGVEQTLREAGQKLAVAIDGEEIRPPVAASDPD